MSGFLLLFAALILLGVHLWKQGRYYYLGFQMPRFLDEWPLVGSFPHLIGSLDNTTKTGIKRYERTRWRSEPMFRVWTGPLLTVFITDVDLVHTILSNHLQKAVYYSFIGGNGLLDQASVPKWAKHRKIIGTSFHHSALKSYISIFHQEAEILADKLKPFADLREAFEPNKLVVLNALASFVRCIFRVDLGIQQNHQTEHPYLEAAESMFEIAITTCLKPWLYIPFIYNAFGYKAKVQKNKHTLKQFIATILQEVRHKMHKENDDVKQDTDEIDYRQNTSFVERTLKLENEIDKFNKLKQNHGMEKYKLKQKNERDEHDLKEIDKRNLNIMDGKDLVKEMIGLTNAGLDTVKTTTLVVLNLLAIHPKVQEEVYAEIQHVFGNDIHSEPTYDQLLKLQALNRVIKEALRLYPSGPIIGRSSPQDIEYGGYTIPAGATIAIFIYGIHRDPKYWSNPNQFNPDRFLSTNTDLNPKAFLPFSLGARNCIGHKYAMLYMLNTLSMILRRYRILVGDKCTKLEDIRFEFVTTLRLLPGNDVRLEERKVMQ